VYVFFTVCILFQRVLLYLRESKTRYNQVGSQSPFIRRNPCCELTPDIGHTKDNMGSPVRRDNSHYAPPPPSVIVAKRTSIHLCSIVSYPYRNHNIYCNRSIEEDRLTATLTWTSVDKQPFTTTFRARLTDDDTKDCDFVVSGLTRVRARCCSAWRERGHARQGAEEVRMSRNGFVLSPHMLQGVL
jgi:hypothetical protein